MEGQQLGQRVPQLSAGDDLVHEAVLLQIFRPLKAVGQLLANGLPDDPGAGKADEGLGLRQDHVSQHGKAGRHAPGGRICQNRNVEKSRVAVAF